MFKFSTCGQKFILISLVTLLLFLLKIYHLGWQRMPEGKVKEIKEIPDAATFWESYAQPKTPLVIRFDFYLLQNVK